jgi:hypothetical protein
MKWTCCEGRTPQNLVGTGGSYMSMPLPFMWSMTLRTSRGILLGATPPAGILEYKAFRGRLLFSKDLVQK